MSQETRFLLKDRDTSRSAIEDEVRTGVSLENVGIVEERRDAEKWEESGKYREYEELPLMEAQEVKTTEFQPVENFEDAFQDDYIDD